MAHASVADGNMYNPGIGNETMARVLCLHAPSGPVEAGARERKQRRHLSRRALRHFACGGQELRQRTMVLAAIAVARKGKHFVALRWRIQGIQPTMTARGCSSA
jgi:hypothetical protein